MPDPIEEQAAIVRAAEVPSEVTPGVVAHIPASDAIPRLLVQVNALTTINHDGEPYTEDDQLVLDGPSAHHLADRGYVTILGPEDT